MQNDRTRTRRAARILVADDDHLVLEMVTDLLTAHGFTVLTAADGEEALAVIKREHPDLVLLDIMMPKLCGYEVARACKSDPVLQSIPIIIITAKGEIFDQTSARKCGAEGYMLKPLNSSLLIAQIRSLLTHSAASRIIADSSSA